MEHELPKVMIVDDEEMIRENLHAYFDDEGFDVVSKSSAESALQALDEVQPDVCIVDMRLPGMTGNEFILSAHGQQPELQFLVHTGSTNYKLPRELMYIGIVREQVFQKPVADMSQFVDAVRRLYAERQTG